jgi:hypothetical protein
MPGLTTTPVESETQRRQARPEVYRVLFVLRVVQPQQMLEGTAAGRVAAEASAAEDADVMPEMAAPPAAAAEPPPAGQR